MTTRETTNLEYKREISKTYLKTVSAFANYGTGKIVFGVDDDGTALGLTDPEDVALRVENAVNAGLNPVPDFSIEVDEKSHTVTLVVREGMAKPYLFAGKAYRRADSSTVEVDRLEYNRLVLSGANMSFDALEVAGQNLVFHKLETELKNKVGLEKLDRNALISLELMSPSGTYNNAAALLADANRFPGTDIARFGDSIGVIRSRHSFQGVSVLDQLGRATDVFDEHYLFEEVSGTSRIQGELIPRVAFREAVANALVHRAWDVRASVQIAMHPDRIEVVSPGGLPAGISEDDYLSGGLSVARNPILANVLFRLGYIERFGTGVPRIYDAYAKLDVSPSFIVRRSSVTVVLPVDGAASFTKEERAVIGVLPKGTTKTRLEIADEAGVSKGVTIRVLNGLIEKGVVERRGAGRSVAYARR